VVLADRLQMSQLLQNLIGNALKFHKPGWRPVVMVGAESVAGSPGVAALCRLIVEDNGIGFDEKYRERIFQVFQKLHGRNEYEGSGIGLALCRKIAERHGGHITAESVPGTGAKFIVTLPCTPITGERRDE
jgi:signal transduction histidine kinase